MEVRWLLILHVREVLLALFRGKTIVLGHYGSYLYTQQSGSGRL